MTNRFSLISTFILLSAVLLLIGCAPSAADYYNRGLTAYNNGNYDEALEDFSQVVSLDPNNAQSHYYLGLTLEQIYAQANPELAINIYTKAISLDPYFTEAYYHRGLTCYTLYNQLLAIESLMVQNEEATRNETPLPMLDSNFSLAPHFTSAECKNMAISDFQMCLSLNISAEIRQSAETYLQELTNTP